MSFGEHVLHCEWVLCRVELPLLECSPLFTFDVLKSTTHIGPMIVFMYIYVFTLSCEGWAGDLSDLVRMLSYAFSIFGVQVLFRLESDRIGLVMPELMREGPVRMVRTTGPN